jgi:uncharacterized membrane protein
MKGHMLVLLVALIVTFVSAQESVNAHEGFNVGMHAGVALAISFTILATFAITVNVIKKKCVKVIP